jgi:hypothetical protein
LYLFQVVNPLHLVNPLHPVNPLQLFNLLIMAKLFILNVHGHQLEEHLVRLLILVWYISSQIFLKTRLTTRTGDRNKFSLLDSPYAPYLIPAWSAALVAVDQSPSHLVEASKKKQNYGHYIFPDPGLFIHPATAGKYIESWLRVRDAWFMRVAKEPSLALSNQSWRTFLSIDNTVREKEETKETMAAHRCQEALDMILPNLTCILE